MAKAGWDTAPKRILFPDTLAGWNWGPLASHIKPTLAVSHHYYIIMRPYQARIQNTFKNVNVAQM